MNYLFCLSRLRGLNYIEYIAFKRKHKYSYEMTGEYAAYIILFLIIFFRIWNKFIEPFVLPWEYVILIIMLLLQKQVVFLLKLSLFIPTSLLFAIVTCCRHVSRI